mmetsp:Transcript_45439/g.108449  ORF Transcript_45439/g.108449 Transcript_45439/m.108449 type:complete len:312 (-) Transcript_45439:47-982(-)
MDFGGYDVDEGDAFNALELPQRQNREQVPGYTGHIHKHRETFGASFANATRVAQQCPPDSPEPTTHWELGKGTRVMTTDGFSLPGTGFTAAAKQSDTQKGHLVYVQGSKVDLLNYYKTLEANNYEQVLIKSGSSSKARSYVNLGDNYYFSGAHVWETTYMESHEEGPRYEAVKDGLGLPSEAARCATPAMEAAVDIDEASYRYRVIQGLVGQERLNQLEDAIRAKVVSRMKGGAGQTLKSFKQFSNGKGDIGPSQLARVVQDLGIDISRREAFALFGRFDINKDGSIVYYEFVDALLQKDVASRDMSYYEK